VVPLSPRPHPWYPDTTEQCLLSPPFVERKDNTPFVPVGAPAVSSSPRLHPWYPDTTEQCLLAPPFVERKDNTLFVPVGAPVISSSPRPHPWYPEIMCQCLLSHQCCPAVVNAMRGLALPGTRTRILSPSTVSRWSVELLS